MLYHGSRTLLEKDADRDRTLAIPIPVLFRVGEKGLGDRWDGDENVIDWSPVIREEGLAERELKSRYGA